MAEREAVLKKAELLTWAYERQAAREAAAHEASKPKPEPAPARRSQHHQGAAEMTRAEMTYYISDQIKRAEDSMRRVLAKTIAHSVALDVVALEKRCEQLERELAELKTRDLDRRLRAVPPSSAGTMIA